MSIIMENAIIGELRQGDLAIDAFEEGDLDLADQHYLAAAYLRGITANYIPCLEGEL